MVSRAMWRSVAALLVVIPLLCARTAAGADLSGHYLGQFQGQPASAQLEQQGDLVSGRYEVAGYLYQLELEFQGSQGEGMLLDPATGGAVPMQASFDGRELRFSIYLGGPGSPPIVAALRRNPADGGAAQAVEPSAGESSGPDPGRAQMPGGQVDPVLVGSWSQSSSYTSGDFSAASRTVVTLAPDGRVIDGGSQVIGGGGMGGFDSGAGGGGGTSGYWSTRGRILYINEGAGWQPVGRYYVEGNSCLLTRGDGSREVWKRY